MLQAWTSANFCNAEPLYWPYCMQGSHRAAVAPLKSAGIWQLLESTESFREKLNAAKAGLSSRGIDWYPYDSLSSMVHLDRLLTGPNRNLLELIGDGLVADIGCTDGEVAFFLESLGCRVHAFDNPLTDQSQMRGVAALRDALGSSVEIHSIDIDARPELPGRYRLVLLLNVLYHLKNPYGVLEMLARRCDYCLLSTRIANTIPGVRGKLHDVPVAYLLDEGELNEDDSNFWIFTESGLRRLLERTKWTVRDFYIAGATGKSDPHSLNRDQRAWCLLESCYSLISNSLELLEGWHSPEDSGWRWTRRRFSARTKAAIGARPVIEIKGYIPDALIERFGSLTLAVSAGGSRIPPQTFREPGRFECRIKPCAALATPAPLQLDFELDHALEPGNTDPRELGIIISSLEIVS